VYISPTWGDAPPEPIATKFGSSLYFTDVINRSKFGIDRYGSFDSVEVHNLPFHIWTITGPYHCSATALARDDVERYEHHQLLLTITITICWYKMMYVTWCSEMRWNEDSENIEKISSAYNYIYILVEAYSLTIMSSTPSVIKTYWIWRILWDETKWSHVKKTRENRLSGCEKDSVPNDWWGGSS